MSSSKGKPDWSKIGRRVKRRGKTYERRCAKLLSEFTNTNFRSTPGSGGFNKQGLVIREELFCGDLICDSPNFRYCVESKNRKVFNFESILKNPETSPFSLWWYQCVNDAKAVNLEPLMFFKPNVSDDFIAIKSEDFCALYTADHFVINAYNRPMTLKVDDCIIDNVMLPTPVVIDWKKFIKSNDAKMMFRG